MMSYRRFLIINILIILLSFALVKPSLARELEVPIPTPGGGFITTIPALPDYIVAIFQFALMAIGIICLGAFIYGGFSYLTSAGSPSAMNDAKDRIFSALLGLIILFSAWLILNTINPELVNLDTLNPIECTGPPVSPVDTCPAGKVCTGGICSTYPGGGGGASPAWWMGCPGYFTSGDCANLRDSNGNRVCDWCSICDSNGWVNTWRKDSCVKAGTACGYTCLAPYCGKTTCP